MSSIINKALPRRSPIGDSTSDRCLRISNAMNYDSLLSIAQTVFDLPKYLSIHTKLFDFKKVVRAEEPYEKLSKNQYILCPRNLFRHIQKNYCNKKLTGSISKIFCYGSYVVNR